MVTSASSPPPARREGERENLFSFITFSFSFLSVNYLFTASLSSDCRGRSSTVVTCSVATLLRCPCPRLFRNPALPLKYRQIVIDNDPCRGLAFGACVSSEGSSRSERNLGEIRKNGLEIHGDP